jgi:hypothetical protein
MKKEWISSTTNQSGFMRKTIFILLVIFPLIPLLFSITKIDLIEIIDYPLTGAFVIPENPMLSIPNILNGKFQTDFEKYFSYNLTGRPTMSRIYNQFMYSIFNSTNTTVIGNTTLIGKEGYLFEFIYIQAYLNEPSEDQLHTLYDKMLVLASLQETLKKMGKPLFVILTPSKVSIYPEYLSDGYHKYAEMKTGGGYSQNFYDYFVSQAKSIGINYFDYHNKFLELKRKGNDIFSKGGIHWTGLAVTEYFNDFIETFNTESNNKIGIIKKIKVTPIWGDPFWPDHDLELLLNLLSTDKKVGKIFPPLAQQIDFVYNYLFPRSPYYSYHMETLSMPTVYRPDVFVVGGSFNWMWLFMVYGIGDWVEHGEKAVFGETYFSYYNSYITKYPESIRSSETTDDFQKILDNDILIIEFNEQAISPEAVQFIFAENLLNYIDTLKG